jgi:HNH endonuclease
MLIGVISESALRLAQAKRMFGSLRLAPSVRIALERRCGGACESCGLEWRWALFVFRVDATAGCTATNLIVLCGTCSAGRADEFAAFVGNRSTRDRVLAANNRRGGTEPLTAGRRRALIAARGGACEVCGASAAKPVLQVHHRLAVLQGGDDREENLQVLCFACHHHRQPCSSGCGAWASKRFGICRNCQMRNMLEQLMPEATWDEIKARFPSFVQQWTEGYEPRPIVRALRVGGRDVSYDTSARKLAP